MPVSIGTVQYGQTEQETQMMTKLEQTDPEKREWFLLGPREEEPKKGEEGQAELIK